MRRKILAALFSLLIAVGVLFAAVQLQKSEISQDKNSSGSPGSHSVKSPAVSPATGPSRVNSKQSGSNTIPNVTPQNGLNPGQNQKIAYLTFDDGPSRQTPQVLDILKAKNVKATFFVIGKDDAKSNEMLKRMAREGHAIGVHSWSHQYSLIYGSESGFLDDFNRLRSHISIVTGLQPNVSRFPGGLNNTVSLKYGGHIMAKLYQDVTAMGIQPFDWNVAAHDATKVMPSKAVIIKNVLSGCSKHPNAIILLHDTNLTRTTLEALPELIDALSSKGFVFQKLSPETPAVVFKPA